MSVTAATSLAEERAHGSLDVLLSTPLSTRSILIGKWWGAFRSIRPVIFWAALIGAVLVTVTGRWLHYALYLALVLAYGVAIASIGMALATWVSRIGCGRSVRRRLCRILDRMARADFSDSRERFLGYFSVCG